MRKVKQMNRTILMILILALCTGCATRVISSNNRSVIIKAGTAMAASAQKMADEECAKHSRYARLALKPMPNEYVFDCVE